MLMGADVGIGTDVLAGAALARFENTFDYVSNSQERGIYKTSMTSVHPYAHWQKDQLRIWLTGGVGNGGISFEEAGFGRQESDGQWLTGAAGGSYRVLSSETFMPGGTTALDLRTEALVTNFRVEENGQLVLPLDVGAHRLRFAARGWHTRALSGGTIVLAPELAARSDGGDGETGTGLELSWSMDYVSQNQRLAIGGHVQSLATFTGDKNEWGVGTNIRLGVAENGLGPSVRVSSSYGMERTGSQLWQDDSIGRIGNPVMIDPLSGSIRLDGEIGYGFRVLHGRGLMTLTGGYSIDGGPADRQTVGALFDIGNLSVSTGVERIDALGKAEYIFSIKGTWRPSGENDGDWNKTIINARQMFERNNNGL